MIWVSDPGFGLILFIPQFKFSVVVPFTNTRVELRHLYISLLFHVNMRNLKRSYYPSYNFRIPIQQGLEHISDDLVLLVFVWYLHWVWLVFWSNNVEEPTLINNNASKWRTLIRSNKNEKQCNLSSSFTNISDENDAKKMLWVVMIMIRNVVGENDGGDTPFYLWDDYNGWLELFSSASCRNLEEENGR